MEDDRRLTTADIAAGTSDTGSDDADRPIERDRGGSVAEADPATEPLLDEADLERYRARWTDVQGSFVDEPQATVRQADELVADLMQALATQFSETRGRLEAQWSSDADVSTEDLRQALMRYRSFFNRLLSA